MKKIYLTLCIATIATSNSLAMQRLNSFRKMLFLVHENMAKFPAPTKFIAEQDQLFKKQLETMQAHFFAKHFRVLLSPHVFQKEEDVLIGNTFSRMLGLSENQLAHMSAADFVAKLNESEKDTPETLTMDNELKHMIKQRADCIQNR